MVKAMDCESEEDCVHVRIPAWAIFFFIFSFFYDDDGGASRSGAGERERRRAGMSAANVGASKH